MTDKTLSEPKGIVDLLKVQIDLVTILTVEIKQNLGQELKMLIPRLHGRRVYEDQKESSVCRMQREWDEFSANAFFQELEEKYGDNLSNIVRAILRWADNKNLCIWPREVEIRSFILILIHKGKSHQLFSVEASGVCEIFFQYISQPPFDSREKRIELLNQLNSIAGILITPDFVDGCPKISLFVLNNESAITQFLEIFTWVIEEIKASKARDQLFRN
jgi:hypothetical protein